MYMWINTLHKGGSIFTNNNYDDDDDDNFKIIQKICGHCTHTSESADVKVH
jgi:hypothetical protein